MKSVDFVGTNEPVWDATNMIRKKGDTTLDICGWCKFRGCGSYRYDCMLDGRCDLLKDYENDAQWDTPCKIKNLGKLDIKCLIRYKLSKISEAKDSIRRTRVEITSLKSLERKAKNIPPSPNARPDYKLGEVIWVFIEKCDKVLETNWYRGKVVPGYRSGDGCVSYVLDELPQSNTGWGCGVSTPWTLTDWEYKFFRKNSKIFETWLKQNNRSYNGKSLNVTSMIEKMKDSE